MKVVLISGHDAEARRKTGFHFWKEILASRGHEVRFLTVGLSAITLLRKNSSRATPPYNKWLQIEAGTKKYTWIPLFHPIYVASDALSKILTPLFKIYSLLLPRAVIDEIRDAQLVIVENGAGPLLISKLKETCTQAAFVYNSSDRLSVLGFHPVVVKGNVKSLEYFDLIRCNAQALAEDFAGHVGVRYIPQGIDKTVFDRPSPSPYRTSRNAVSVGDMLFDAIVIASLAAKFPHWTFHLFGRGAKLNACIHNVIEYGEVAFERVAPYIQHADIGLAPYRAASNSDYLSQSSLKMTQYTYCQLPIVAPNFAAGLRLHVIGYDPLDPVDASRAFLVATTFDRTTIDKSECLSWEQVINQIMQEAVALSKITVQECSAIAQ